MAQAKPREVPAGVAEANGRTTENTASACSGKAPARIRDIAEGRRSGRDT